MIPQVELLPTEQMADSEEGEVVEILFYVVAVALQTTLQVLEGDILISNKE